MTLEIDERHGLLWSRATVLQCCLQQYFFSLTGYLIWFFMILVIIISWVLVPIPYQNNTFPLSSMLYLYVYMTPTCFYVFLQTFKTSSEKWSVFMLKKIPKLSESDILWISILKSNATLQYIVCFRFMSPEPLTVNISTGYG